MTKTTLSQAPNNKKPDWAKPIGQNLATKQTVYFQKIRLLLDAMVLTDIPGPEDLQREKIMKALKIRRAMYFRTLKEVDEMLS